MSNPRDYVIVDGVLVKYVGAGGSIVIPENVSEIGAKAFFKRSDLTSVVIPETVLKIGDNAFSQCEGLVNVVFPHGLASIGEWAFSHCAFESLNIQGNELIIGPDAFAYCQRLTTATMDGWIKQIGADAFTGCTELRNVVFSKETVCIANNAFSSCDNLISIVLPKSLRRIGKGVFENCSNLATIEVEADCECCTSDDGILFDREKTKLIAFPAGKTEFSGYVIPESVKELEDSAFYSCHSLKSIELPNRMVRIGARAFYGCKALESICIPETVREIGNHAFIYCESLTSITIPYGVRGILAGTFEDCKRLQKISLPNELKEIGSFAFADCFVLTEIEIPDSVVKIGYAAFSGCSCKITKRWWTEDLTQAIERDMKRSVKGCTPRLICTDTPPMEIPIKYREAALLGFAQEEEKDLKSERAAAYLKYAKKNVRKLCGFAFDNPELLRLFFEQKMIKAKDLDAFLAEAEKRADLESKILLLNYQNQIGLDNVNKARERKEESQSEYSALRAERAADWISGSGVEGLTFVITGKLWSWVSRDEVEVYLAALGAKLESAISKRTDYLVANDPAGFSEIIWKAQELGVEIISEADFNAMVGLGKNTRMSSSQIIKNSVIRKSSEKQKSEKEGTHSETAMNPEGKRGIDHLIFAVTGKLETFVNRDDLKGYLLENGAQLTSTLSARVNYLIMTEYDSIKEAKAKMLGVEIISEEKLYELAGDRFQTNGSTLTNYWGINETVTVPANVTVIGCGAFSGRKRLKCVIIPASVKTIEDSAFSGCTVLEEAGIPNSVTSIGKDAFMDCRSLRKVKLPMHLKRIGNNVFWMCEGLTELEIPEGVPKISDRMFRQCRKLKSVTIPKTVKKIGDGAFRCCYNLTDVTISDGVQIIDQKAFLDCFNLKKVTIPNSVTYIGDRVFEKCEKLTIHAPKGSYAEQYARRNLIAFVAE